MHTFIRNVAGIFVAKDRKRDVSNFNDVLRSATPSYLGISFQGNSDLMEFTFNDQLISNSSAEDILTTTLDDYAFTSLDLAKLAKKEEINAMRDKRLYDHFPYAGARWDCNSESRANITGTNTLSVLNGGHLPPGMVWRDFDNNNHLADAMFMAQMGGALMVFSNAVYTHSWILKTQLTALTNATDVDNFNYLDGWPSMDP